MCFVSLVPLPRTKPSSAHGPGAFLKGPMSNNVANKFFKKVEPLLGCLKILYDDVLVFRLVHASIAKGTSGTTTGVSFLAVRRSSAIASNM